MAELDFVAERQRLQSVLAHQRTGLSATFNERTSHPFFWVESLLKIGGIVISSRLLSGRIAALAPLLATFFLTRKKNESKGWKGAFGRLATLVIPFLRAV